jgi:hypothetical protein
MLPRPSETGYDAFVSYSHEDKPLVDPVARVLQLGGRRVFWDSHDLAAGTEWRPALEKALKNSAMVVVLWCCDSAKSKWVAKEIRLARRHSIPVVAIRLCRYPIPPKIRKYQWADLQGVVVHVCDHERPSGPSQPDPRAKTGRVLVGAQERRTQARGVLAMSGFGLGLIVLLLALMRPFPSSLTPVQADQLNGLIAIIGGVLAALSLVDIRALNSQRKVLSGRTRETLEMILDGLISGGRDPATTPA